MIETPPPVFMSYAAWSFAVRPHTISGGDKFARTIGPGAIVTATVSVPALCPNDAAELRAFGHKLQSTKYAVRLMAPDVPRPYAHTEPYTDETDFTDDSDFTDCGRSFAEPPTLAVTALAASAGAGTVTITPSIGANVVGCFAVVGSQTVRIVDVDGDAVSFRPRLRNDLLAGSPVATGAVPLLFRLDPQAPPPIVSMRPTRSEPVVFNFVEVWR